MNNRPYIQVYIEIDGVQFAIPLSSEIHHPHVLWTDKANHCGVDSSIDPHLGQNEFDVFRGKDFKIKRKIYFRL